MSEQSIFDTRNFNWTEEILNEFFAELEKAARLVPPEKSSFLVDSLAEPMPDLVKRYFEGASDINFNRHIAPILCKLKCALCGTIVSSRWLSKSSAKSSNRMEKPHEPASCSNCQSEYNSSYRMYTQKKWRHLIRLADEHWEENQEPIHLSFSESTKIANSVFNGTQDYYERSWKVRGGFSSIKELALRNMISMSINDECHLEVTFGEITVGDLEVGDHTKMILDWGMNHIEQMGSDASRGDFMMSLKYREEILMIIADSSYYQLSYAIFRAKKETAALWELQRRKREITFKSALRETLQKLISGEWNVPPGSTFYAEKDVPDSFWSLVRLKKHDLKHQEILSWPLGLLAEAIEADSTDQSRVSH